MVQRILRDGDELSIWSVRLTYSQLFSRIFCLLNQGYTTRCTVLQGYCLFVRLMEAFTAVSSAPVQRDFGDELLQR